MQTSSINNAMFFITYKLTPNQDEKFLRCKKKPTTVLKVIPTQILIIACTNDLINFVSKSTSD